jgi:hypothetical protein
MSFATLVDRARTDFTEMPRLELSLPQAGRLWSLGADDCRFVVDALVDAGFLMWTTRRTIMRTGRDLPLGLPLPSHIRVRQTQNHDKSVDRE